MSLSFETWVQLGVGIVLTIIAPLLGELFWKSLALTLAGFCFGVALWQLIESHDWHREYFVAGCVLLTVMLSSFILWSTPRSIPNDADNSKAEPQSTARAPIATQSEPQATATEPTKPKLELPAFSEKLDSIVFSLGGGGMRMSYTSEQLRKGPQTPFFFAGYAPVTLMMEKDKILYTVKFLNKAGQVVVEIVNDEFIVRLQFGWDSNSTANALEVVNETGLPVFQMIRKTPSYLVVNGVFHYPGGMVIATDEELVFDPDENVMRTTVSLLVPIFKYPAWKYRGVYAEQSPKR